MWELGGKCSCCAWNMPISFHHFWCGWLLFYLWSAAMQVPRFQQWLNFATWELCGCKTRPSLSQKFLHFSATWRGRRWGCICVLYEGNKGCRNGWSDGIKGQCEKRSGQSWQASPVSHTDSICKYCLYSFWTKTPFCNGNKVKTLFQQA